MRERIYALMKVGANKPRLDGLNLHLQIDRYGNGAKALERILRAPQDAKTTLARSRDLKLAKRILKESQAKVARVEAALAELEQSALGSL